MIYKMVYRKRSTRRPVRKMRPRRRYGAAKMIPYQRRFRGQGYINIKRRIKPILFQNSNTIGIPLVTDPNGCMTLGTLVPNPNGSNWDIPFSLQFNLQQLQDSTDITQLCDAYKIKYVKITAYYSQGVVGASSLKNPVIKWVTDHDDATPPSVGDLLSKQGVRSVYMSDDRIVHMGVSPRVAVPAYRDTPLPFAYIVPRSQWLNSSYNGVPHYGIKGVIQDFNLLAGGGGTVAQIRFDIEFSVCGRDFQ